MNSTAYHFDPAAVSYVESWISKIGSLLGTSPEAACIIVEAQAFLEVSTRSQEIETYWAVELLPYYDTDH